MVIVDLNGYRIEFTEKGDAEPLVFVHGSAADHRTWRLQHDAFGERFRAIAYSRRYHWPNEPIPDDADYSMAEHVEDLRELCLTLGAVPAHLVGHSYGAFLCLLLAIREPNMVRSLVLAEPPVVPLFASNQPTPREIVRLFAIHPRAAAAIMKFGLGGIAPARRAFLRGDRDTGVRRFGDAVFGPGGFDRLPESRKRRVMDNVTNIEAELLGSGFEPLREEQVRGVEAPALLVTGERSIGLFRRLSDRLAQLLPRVERVEVPAASHMMHEDNAPAYNAAVLRFVMKQRADSATREKRSDRGRK